MKKIISFLCLAFLLVSCQWANKQKEVVMGESRQVLECSFNRAVAAGNRTLESLQYRDVAVVKDSLIANITGLNADGKKITVRLENKTEKSTLIKVSVAGIGGKDLAQRILEKLKADYKISAYAVQ